MLCECVNAEPTVVWYFRRPPCEMPFGRCILRAIGARGTSFGPLDVPAASVSIGDKFNFTYNTNEFFAQRLDLVPDN